MQQRRRAGHVAPQAVMLALAVALGGCASKPDVPPITSADPAVRTPGAFVWYDLLTEDLDGVKRFYGELLGWTFEDTQLPHYTLIEHQGRTIGGIVDMSARNNDVNESQWISVLSVADVDEAVAATRRGGGEVHVAPTDLPGRGRFAIVGDPQGAVVALLRASRGDPPQRKARNGDWLWTELWTDDVAGATGFYGQLAGFELETETILDDIEYKIFTRDGRPRAGVIPNPFDEVLPHWLPYVRVEDPAALAERVAGLGGRVVLAPAEDVRDGSVAVVLDPSGGAVALQTWPDPS